MHTSNKNLHGATLDKSFRSTYMHTYHCGTVVFNINMLSFISIIQYATISACSAMPHDTDFVASPVLCSDSDHVAVQKPNL